MKTRVTEIERRPLDTAATGQLLEPFFRSREEADTIRRTQSMAERSKFADAFALVGCVRCQSKDRLHAACGFCETCYAWYTNVLKRVVKNRAKGEL